MPTTAATDPLSTTVPAALQLGWTMATLYTRSVRKLEPSLKPPADTRGSVRPAGRVDVSVLIGA
jgi:hypothetical protein